MWLSPSYLRQTGSCEWRLSRQVEEEFKPYSNVLVRRKPWMERLAQGEALALIFLGPLIIPGLAILASWLSPAYCASSSGTSNPNTEVIAAVRSTGAILGALSGILITIIVFTIDIRRADLPGAGPLLRLYATERGYLPVAALVLGTTASIIILSLCVDTFSMWLLTVCAWIAGWLAYVCIGLELSLIHI